MSWNARIRRTHRVLSVVFTLTVVVCFAALAGQEPAAWVFYTPLPPLALLMGTGLYLFTVPYTARWRSGPIRRESR